MHEKGGSGQFWQYVSLQELMACTRAERDFDRLVVMLEREADRGILREVFLSLAESERRVNGEWNVHRFVEAIAEVAGNTNLGNYTNSVDWSPLKTHLNALMGKFANGSP